MRLEKFFGCKVNEFFTANNVTAEHSPADDKMIKHKIKEHMRGETRYQKKEPVPIFYATKKLLSIKDAYKNYTPCDKIQYIPHYEITIHAKKPDTKEHIVLFYLDWYPNETHFIDLSTDNSGENPNFFMTALMDGCSLHFEGNDKLNPIIKHSNAMTVKSEDPNYLNLSQDKKTESDYKQRKLHMEKESKKLQQKDLYSHSRPKKMVGLQPGDYRDLYGNSKEKAKKDFKEGLGKDSYFKKKLKTNKRAVHLETKIQCYGVKQKDGWVFYMSKKLFGMVKFRDHFYSKKWNSYLYVHLFPPIEIYPDTTYSSAYLA